MNWREHLREVEPYVAGEQPKLDKIIKLNTNENPYHPGKKVQEVLKKINVNKLNLYPDPESKALKQSLASLHQINEENVFIGNGSDEVLALTFLTCFNHGTLYFPDITYSFYPVFGELYQIDYKQIPLREDFSINFKDYPETMGGMIFPNPNAPTGKYVDKKEIEALLQKHQECIIVVDEAYIDFGGESVLPLINKYENLLVIHTFSKFRSLAGIRLGAAFGSKELISKLNDVKNSFNSYPVDSIAQAIGKASIEDTAYIKDNANKIIATREKTCDALRQLGFIIPESKANFIFASHPRISAEEIFYKLREKGIIVRYFNKPRIYNYLRITIGLEEEMEELVQEIKNILGSV